MDQQEIRIGITHGDINGIGYEVIMKALADQRVMDNATVIVYGSPKVAAFHRKSFDLPNFNFNLIKTAEEAARRKANIINYSRKFPNAFTQINSRLFILAQAGVN